MDDNKEPKKVPLGVGWLSENDMLLSALKVRGMALTNVSRNDGIVVMATLDKVPSTLKLEWYDNLMFTTDELKEMGFE